MNKSPEAFRTISEVAEALDVPPHVLRFWETRFTQVKPVKRGGGRRYYRPEDVRLLRGIRGLLYDDGMTIKGVQKILRERGIRHVIALGTTAEGPDAAAPAAARPAATPRPAPRAAPAPVVADVPSVAADGAQASLPGLHDGAGPPRPLDRSALRGLIAELEALRELMTAPPGPRARARPAARQKN